MKPVRQLLDMAMSEEQFSQQVVDAARTFGWLVYRTWNSQHSPKGFPDLCMVRGERLIFAELKAAKRTITSAQQEWLGKLQATEKAEVYLFWPSDFEKIVDILR